MSVIKTQIIYKLSKIIKLKSLKLKFPFNNKNT